MKLAGRRALITGASQGFGLEVAREFVKQGAHITFCAREQTGLNNALQQLTKLTTSTKIISVKADITQEADMDHLYSTAMKQMGGIDIVVANAGIYGAKGAVDEIDWHEWSHTIDINLKGTVLVCKKALPILKQQHYGKIILLSGGGATKPMPFLSAYAASKAAVVRFGESLALEVKEFNIDVNSVAPGALNTRLLDEILAAGPEKIGHDFYQQSLKQKQTGGSPLNLGAELCAYLASNESDGITGKLISAIWDPWQQFNAGIKNQLCTSDIYTLRRIVPEDRQ